MLNRVSGIRFERNLRSFIEYNDCKHLNLNK